MDEDAESAGAPGASLAEEPNRELADAGMVLRDPSTFHMLVHHVSGARRGHRQAMQGRGRLTRTADWTGPQTGQAGALPPTLTCSHAKHIASRTAASAALCLCSPIRPTPANTATDHPPA